MKNIQKNRQKVHKDFVCVRFVRCLPVVYYVFSVKFMGNEYRVI